MKAANFERPANHWRFPTIIALAAIAAGCSSSSGFRSTEHEDVTPFAQKTVEVLGLQNIQLRDNELVYLRDYVDSDFVELDQLQAMLERTDAFRDRVISYSVDLVRVTEMYDSEADKVAAYADGVDHQLQEQAVAALDMSEQDWDAVMTDIRAQPNFLAALRAVQPIINKAGQFYEELLFEIEKEVLVEVRAEFDRRIQAEYAEPIRFIKNYYNRRDEILLGLNLIYAYRHGDIAAAEGIREVNAVVHPSLLPKGDFTAKDIDAIDTALRDELIQNTLLLTQLEKDIEGYEKTRDELDRKESEVIASLGLARLQFVTWSRSHQALANGVKEPGKWMELSVKAGQLLGKAL
jgi:hypothetical protein